MAVFASMLIGERAVAGFDPLQLAALGAAAIGSTMVARSGETNWLEGLQLLRHLLHRGGDVLAV